MTLPALQVALRDFALQRAWAQFHSPKNLAMALSVEVGELLEPFQWLTEEQSRDPAAAGVPPGTVEDELADVLLYLLQLADQLGIDLEAAAWQKLAKNAQKYPVELARDNAIKR